MKSTLQFLSLAIVLSLVLALLSCGGGSATSAGPESAVSVAIAEDSVALGAGEQHQFSVTVTGTSNKAVVWNLSGCAGVGCGTISATGLYTAPPAVSTTATVRVIAALQADPSKFDTAAVNHMPISISITPKGAWVMPGNTTDFRATVLYDRNKAGVIWTLTPQCTDANCGALSKATLSSVAYTAPATLPAEPKLTLTATSITDPTQMGTVTISVSATSALMEGDYAYIFNGWEIRTDEQGFYWSYEVARSGHFHADGKGKISHGVEDINSDSNTSQSVPFTGTYGTGPDHRGNLIITSARGTESYNVTISASGSSGKFIRSDDLPATSAILGAGSFELQDNKSFSLSALAGDYVVGLFGSEDWNRVAAVGRFSVSPGGVISRGKLDLTMATHIGASSQATFTNLALSGSLDAPSSATGRGTATLALSPAPSQVKGDLKFVYYPISNEKILLIQTDARDSTTPVLSGEIRRQTGPFSNASFDGPGIFSMTGVNRANYGAEIVHAIIGQMVANGSGSVTGTIDDNGGQAQPVLNKAFTGSYSIAPDGRSTLRLALNNTLEIAYFFAPNQAFLLQTSGTDVLFGSLKPQAAGPFTAASVAGTFLTATAAPASEQAESDCGLTTFDGAGRITSAMDVTRWGSSSPIAGSGTYVISANGRGTLTFTPPVSNQPIVFWVTSPAEVLGIGKMAPMTPWSTVLNYEK